jgi:hypothetical protein
MTQHPLFKVGTRFEEHRMAGPGELFAEDAFGRSAGATVQLRVAGQRIGSAVIIAVQVANDGTSALFTYEITEISPGQEDDTENPVTGR